MPVCTRHITRPPKQSRYVTTRTWASRTLRLDSRRWKPPAGTVSECAGAFRGRIFLWNPLSVYDELLASVPAGKGDLVTSVRLSNGTKTKEKNTMAMQCQYYCSERPAHVKWTQQSLCINFVRPRSSATLGNAKLNCSWHCFIKAISDVLNSFINSRLITKSNDWVWVLFRGHTSRPYNKTGTHLLFMNCSHKTYINSNRRTVSKRRQGLTMQYFNL